jgi:hypothetical protein
MELAGTNALSASDPRAGNVPSEVWAGTRLYERGDRQGSPRT